MATVRDSWQGAGNLVSADGSIRIKKTDIEQYETVVASWNQFR
jgi:hypothetical protein